MKWITRERARVDRIACPWLITRFIDPKPEFLFVPASDVLTAAKREDAIPYDVPNVELGHQGPRCSFDAFVDRGLTPESSGLYAAATGFQAISRDDFDNMARQFPMYDALYAYCSTHSSAVPPPQ